MPEHASPHSPFELGRNCWRIEHADRAAFIVDADAYFKALVAAARKAQRSILIVGWDFHSRTRLLGAEEAGGAPLELGAFLNALVERRPLLEVHILIWDYPMIFGMDREWAPIVGLGWKPHRRVHFRYDNTHPVGGSHHQKIVVIDDALAFCGGIDLTCRRWDTCEHAAQDARRVVQGEPYPPFHDLMMAVDGDAARALGELVRERWRRATGDVIVPPEERRRLRARAAREVAEATRPGTPGQASWQRWRLGRRQGIDPRWLEDRPPEYWPPELPVDVQDVAVGISRTQPATNGKRGVREIEALYLDMIGAARRLIYIENQYFTSDAIGRALAERLAEDDGPEVVLILRRLSHGWLEELTMQNLRTHLIERLLAADRHDRFRPYYPHIAGLDDDTCIDVHAKLMIVDDEIVRIGSANLANRSMGLDTECDLSIAAQGREDVRQSIRALRLRLLAEHLGCSPQDVATAEEAHGSLHAAIEHLERDDRTLRRLEPELNLPEPVLDMIGVADPEAPVELGALMKIFNADVEVHERRAWWVRLGGLVVAVAVLTAVWRLTPLADVLTPERVVAWAQSFGDHFWAPLLVLAAYTPACIVMFPRPLITLFAVTAFGPLFGFLYAMLGIQIAAWVTYVAGRHLDRSAIRRLAGAKLNRIIEVLRHRGLLAMTALRLVPLAPFAVEGAIAGAVRIRLWHYLLGTALGMLPGTLAATVFGDQLQALFHDRREVNWWLIGTMLVALAVLTWWVRRWVIRSSRLPATHPTTGPARAR